MGPERIICLTEEPTEMLYLLGEEKRIVGISVYTERPPKAKEEKQKFLPLSAEILKKLHLSNQTLSLVFPTSNRNSQKTSLNEG